MSADDQPGDGAAAGGDPAGTGAAAAGGGAARDSRGVWARRLSEQWEFLGCSFYGLVMRFKAWFWAVEFGERCRFYGPALLGRVENSTIVVGRGCIFRSGVKSNRVGVDRPCSLSTLGSGATLEIGDDCGFSGTVIAAAESITLGNRVVCGGNTTITDTDWHERGSAPVVLEDDVFIGLGTIVLKGVTIGHGTFVGAGSVVTRSLPPMVVAAGNPARVIREL